MGRNPATGKPLKIPAKTVVRMRIAKAAKDAIVPGRKQKKVSGRVGAISSISVSANNCLSDWHERIPSGFPL
jgi:urease beta subunit